MIYFSCDRVGAFSFMKLIQENIRVRLFKVDLSARSYPHRLTEAHNLHYFQQETFPDDDTALRQANREKQKDGTEGLRLQLEDSWVISAGGNEYEQLRARYVRA